MSLKNACQGGRSRAAGNDRGDGRGGDRPAQRGQRGVVRVQRYPCGSIYASCREL